MDFEGILNTMNEPNDLPGQTMPEIAENCGMETAKNLLKHYKGCQLNIPGLTSDSLKPYILNFIKDNWGLSKVKTLRRLAQNTAKSEETIRRLIRELIAEGKLKGDERQKFLQRSTDNFMPGFFDDQINE